MDVLEQIMEGAFGSSADRSIHELVKCNEGIKECQKKLAIKEECS